MKPDSKQEKLWQKDYIFIITAACGIAFTTHFFLSTLPIYAQKISNTNAYSGFMTGAYTLTALAVRPISGVMMDKMGRVKFLIFGALICSITCFSYYFAGSIIFLIFLRMLNGVGFGIHSTAAGAVAADVIPKSRMMEGMGYFYVYATIAFAIAPGISLSIIGEGQIEKFKLLFILASLVALLSMVLDSRITYEGRRKKSPESKDRKEDENVDNAAFNNIPDLRQLPNTFLGFEYAVFLPAFIVFLIYLGQSSVLSFLALYALEFKIGNVGLFYTFLAIGMFITRLVTGKIGDKHGPNIVIIPTLSILMLSYLLIPFIHSWIMLLLMAFPIGFTIGTVFPMLNALIINRCSPYRRGTASAAFFSAVDLGVGIGSIFFGFIITVFTYTYMFWGSFAFTFLSLIIYIFGIAKKRSF